MLTSMLARKGISVFNRRFCGLIQHTSDKATHTRQQQDA